MAKAKPRREAEKKLERMIAFGTELFTVPKAQIDEAEAKRPKRPSRKRSVAKPRRP